MPIPWLFIGKAALTAGIGHLTKEAIGKVTGIGAGLFSQGGPIDKDLAGALASAGEGFEASLNALYPDDRDLSELVEQLAKREDFQQALGSLPYVPFVSIDVEDVREVFVERRGTDDAGEDFDGAWRAASKRFLQATAKKEEVGRFVELQHQARSEQREEAQLAKFEEIRSLLEKMEERQARKDALPDEGPILAAYRRGVYEEFRYADTSGLFQREKVPPGEAIGLEEVFVETQLGREPRRRTTLEDESDADFGEKNQPKPDAPSEPIEILPIREVLSRDRLTVILGPPGSGKSTLMRCLALSICRAPDAPPPALNGGLDTTIVPVLIAFKEYASALRDDSNLALESFLFKRFASRLPHLKELLNSGRALLLFDGFDEVFDELHRLWVSNQVWSFVSQFPAARIVLTSRPHGYASAPLLGPVTLWKIQPFGEAEIHRFLRGWFSALAREGGEAGSQDPPEKRAETLAKEILSRERLREMAENPLLSTLIVLVHRNRSGRLPDRRVVFFEAAAKTFAESWERAKHAQEGEESYEFPEPEILLRALAEVAWRAHHELGGREIPGETLRQWLGAYLEREAEWSGARGRRAVKDFLRLVDQRTGLLVDLGGGAYQIVHLSLHEWFVSYYLLDRLQPEKRLVVLRHYLHVPEWEEVLRLTIAGARQAEAEAMIEGILDQPSHEMEPRLRRDFRFVLRCMGDRAAVGLELRQRIVNEALRALHDPGVIDQPGLIAALSPLDGTSTIRNEFIRRLESDDPGVRSYAIPYFARIGASDGTARRALLQWLDDKDHNVRESAVFFFAQTGDSIDTVRQAILRRLDDEDPGVRSSAISYFARIGVSDDTIRQVFLLRLNDHDPIVRSSAVSYFARIAASDATVRQAVFRQLDDKNHGVRYSAISYFTRLSTAEDCVKQAILRRFDDEGFGVRASAIDFFTQTGASDEHVQEAIFGMISDYSATVRSAAIDFFAQSGANDERLRQTFLSLLEDLDPEIRGSAIAFFVRTGANEEATHQAIVRRLDDEDDVVRAAAFECAFQGDFLPIEAGDPLALFDELASSTAGHFDEQFSQAIGNRAASDTALRHRLFDECPRIEYFRLGVALEALATEQDRLRRATNPLPF